MTSVSREAFLHVLESVAPGLSPREIVEQSACVVFRGGRACTYNDEVSCRAPSGLPKEVEGAVQAEPLLALLRKLPEENVTVEAAAGRLTVAGKGRRAWFRLEAEVVLPVDQVERPKRWTPLPPEFAEAVAVVGQCAGTDESQTACVCVHVTPDWVEASDNVQACRWRLKTGVSQPTLVRQTSLKHVVSAGATELAETDQWLHFRNPRGLILSCRRYLDDYPALGKFLKAEGAAAALPPGLADAVDRANDFSKELKDANYVLVDLRPGKVAVAGEGVNGGYREVKKLPSYKGEPLAFYVAPSILQDLVQKHRECVVAPERLKVDGGHYTYVTCLLTPEERNGAAGAAGEEGEAAEVPPKKKRKEPAAAEADE